MIAGDVAVQAGASRTTQMVIGHSSVTTFFSRTFLTRGLPQSALQVSQPSQLPPKRHFGRQYSMHFEE